MKQASKKQTPLIEQYCTLKDQYSDCILFFRVGDFYEMFFDDAKSSAHTLNIALTSYGKNSDIPMCGIPYHSSEAYIQKLVHSGSKVALCEQTESVFARFDKKQPLKRDVVRVITAGTLTESSMLDPKSYNFLICCSHIKNGKVAYALVDLSVGDFYVQEIEINELHNVFAKWNPSECLISDSVANNDSVWSEISEWHSKAQLVPNLKYELTQSEDHIKSIYGVANLASFCEMSHLETSAAGYLAYYLMYTQKMPNIDIKPIVKMSDNGLVHLDKFTRDNLEIVKTLQGSNKGALFDTLDATITAGGARLLKLRLMSPTSNIDTINDRLEDTSFFIENFNLIGKIQNYLNKCEDLERALGRIILNRSTPVDLVKIATSLDAVQDIYNLVCSYDLPEQIKQACEFFNMNGMISQKIKAAIVENPPLKVCDGGFICVGYSSALDGLRNIKSMLDEQIKHMQDDYRSSTNISTLRIKHNNIFGYCIEVPVTQKKKIPYGFKERQTLSTVSRYGTDELSDLSVKILQSREMQIQKEIEILNDVNDFVKSMKKSIYKIAESIAILDVTLSVAQKSIDNRYCKPTINNNLQFTIKNGRNPIIENILSNQNDDFTANDCELSASKCVIMTGPNMAGKSTYLRQNALIVLMAQVGLYVPADEMELGVVDGLFVRIGASDNLSKGMSTFMMEMSEISCILRYATERSFIVVDEVGRGTSASEGAAIAAAIVRDISNRKIRSVFATHYHELVDMLGNDQNLLYKTMHIKEIDGDLVFMHKVVDGIASHSYALQVCKMAGIPRNIIDDAKNILKQSDM